MSTATVTMVTCEPCTDRIVCHCLRITEAQVVETIQEHRLSSLREVVRHTGAGNGCTACRCALRTLLEQHRASVPLPLPFETADSSASRLAG
jgi:bacterioferritin-associated ferredoxin